LALKVVRLDEVAIDNSQPSDPRTSQRIGQYGTERATADDQDPAFKQPALTSLAKRTVAHLSRVSFHFGWKGHTTLKR
jgi:hypothetical protein